MICVIFKKDIKLSRNNNIIYPTHMMGIVDPKTIAMETLMIDNECSLKKKFIKLIYMNP